MIGRKLLYGFAAALLIGLAYLFFRTPSEIKQQNLERVTVAQVGDFFLYIPLYYAKDKGFFEKSGLEVQIINSGGDDKSVAAVLSGSAQFGVGDPTFAAIASEKGQTVKVVASVVNGVPFWGVTKRSDISPISNPSQLKGFRVATFPKPSTAYALQEEMFEEGGLRPNIVQAQFGSLLPLLDTGGADIVLELEPNVATAEANGAKVVYSLASAYPDFAMTGVTVKGDFATMHPQTVRAFVTGLEEAIKFAHDHPEDLITYAEGKFPNLPKAVVAAGIKRMLSEGTFPRTTRVSPAGWQKALQLRVDSGDLRSINGASQLLAWPLGS